MCDVQIRALVEISYGGKLRRVGDEFTATKRDADLLQLVGRAEAVKPSKTARRPTRRKYERWDMKAKAASEEKARESN